MTTPAPCPFCGSVLVKTRNGWHHPTIKEGSQPCPLVGHHFGDNYIPWVGWKTETPFCHYEVVDGLPVFNTEGRGEPASVQFLNDCFNYIRSQANGK